MQHAVSYLKILFFTSILSLPLAAQQFPVCVPNAGNSSLRAEGLTESATTITLSCSGATPNVSATAMVNIFTPVNITNHLSTNNVPDVVVSVTAGGFAQPTPANITLVGNNQLSIAGIQYTPGSDGGVTIAINNLRLDVHAAANGTSPLLTANILATGLTLTNTTVQLGAIATGLLASENSTVTYGSTPALPQTLTMQNLFTAGNTFTTTRVTEGFANAFKSKGQDPEADFGTRIMMTFSQLPAGTQIVVPAVIAGSSSVQPTSAGALGEAQSAGVYASSATGSLLLALVTNPNSDGSGGGPFYTPPANTPPTTLMTAVSIPVTNGSAMVVYEVVDSNLTVQESAQIPVFFALSPGTQPGTYGQTSLSFAPVSTVTIADMTDPVPRFAAVTPPSDCTTLGDCTAGYFPQLKLNISSISLSAPENGAQAVGYLPFVNAGGGVMQWTASVSYQQGSGWLSLSATSGTNNTTINLHANPANLAPGVYNATVTINAGPMAGTQSVPVMFRVGQAAPLVTQVANAANGNISTLVPGSFGSLYGSGLSGSNVTVAIDGVSAAITYSSASQINFVVPPALTGTSAQLVVTAGGVNSAPVNVNLATAAPAIFPNGVLNQNNTVNGPNNAAPQGSTLQIYLTGLPPVSGATVTIGNSSLQSSYSGAAPGVPGLQQVNVMLPANLAGTAQLTVCTAGPNPVCTPAFQVSIQ